jgi:hypothetical protein
MPPTPGKRVTRSRAAASKTADEMNAPAKRAATTKSATSRRLNADVEDLKKGEDTIAGTAAKRPSQATLNPVPTITTARRRIKVTPLDVSASEDKPAADATADNAATKKPKSSSKGKKEPKVDDAIPDDQQQLDKAEKITKPKTRGKAAAHKDKIDETQAAPKTRGRSKKMTASEPIEEPQQQQPVRQTRTRAGSGAATSQAPAISTAKGTAATRKKVTFQDLPESDKENQPLVATKPSSKGQGVPAASGIRAKPVRKPVTAKGRKTVGSTNKNTLQQPKPTPLSPKKVMQVAKSSSPGTSDEDELSGAKTPVRDLSQSPKRNGLLGGTLSPVKKLDFGTALLVKSPDREAPGTTLMSPPRKLPPTPFKDALKESPKRGEGALIFPLSAAKATATTVVSAPTSQSQSVLLQSPKRGAIDGSIFTQSAIKPFKSPAKPILMQSPPKRLLPSFKPSGSEVTPARAGKVLAETDETRLNNEPADVSVSCNFRSSQSPERSLRVQKISGEQLPLGAPASIDFDESILDIRSPIKVFKPATSSLQSTAEEAEPFPIFSTEETSPRPAPDASNTSSYQDEVNSFSTGPGEPMEGVAASLEAEKVEFASTSVVTSASKGTTRFLFRSAHLHDDESSEDELQAENAFFGDGMTQTPAISGRSIRSRLSTVNPAETSRNVGFTPLAAQFSTWLASSPDKAVRKNAQQQSVFSPLATQHVSGKVQVSRQSTPQRRSVGSRFSMTAASSADRRGMNSVRKSSGSVMAGTPERSSYFADEMAIKDFEDEVESQQVTREELNSPEIVKNTEDLALVEKEAPVVVADIDVVGLDDVALLGKASNETQAHDNENISPTTTAPGCLSADAEAQAEAQSQAAEENTQTVLAIEEPASAGDAKLIESSDGMERSGPKFEDEDSETNHQPASSTQDYATPARQSTILPRFANTVVSKVPLRPEGYISPIKIPKKRSRSLSGGPSSAKKAVFPPSLIPQSTTVISLSPEPRAKYPAPDTPGQQSFVVDDFGDSTLDDIEIDEHDENLPPPTPSAVVRSMSTTAGRGPLRAVENGALKGAVVFVDVHTTEGADASGIFVELLTQMGARCVRHWSWNPRASIAGGEAESGYNTSGALVGKVGITHVVYKDGGRRTLEKVKDAGGVVRCVGVGWVLE